MCAAPASIPSAWVAPTRSRSSRSHRPASSTPSTAPWPPVGVVGTQPCGARRETPPVWLLICVLTPSSISAMSRSRCSKVAATSPNVGSWSLPTATRPSHCSRAASPRRCVHPTPRRAKQQKLAFMFPPAAVPQYPRMAIDLLRQRAVVQGRRRCRPEGVAGRARHRPAPRPVLCARAAGRCAHCARASLAAAACDLHRRTGSGSSADRSWSPADGAHRSQRR